MAPPADDDEDDHRQQVGDRGEQDRSAEHPPIVAYRRLPHPVPIDVSLVSWGDAVLGRLDRRWGRLVQADELDGPRFPYRRHLITAAAIAGFAGFDAARRSLDQSLAKIHPATEPGFGANRLHDGPAAVREAISAWERGYDEFGGFIDWSGREVAAAQTAVELLLVPFSALALFGVLQFLRQQLEQAVTAGDVARPDPHRTVLRISCLAVVAYAALGVFDQVVELLLIWLASPTDGVAVLAWPLRLGSFLRRAALAAILVPIVNELFLLARNSWHPIRRLRLAGSAYRVLLTVGVLHVALLQLSIPAEQSRDAIRLWPQRHWLAVWGIAATAGFAVAQAVLALRLGTLPARDGRLLGRRGTLRLIAAGGALAAAGGAIVAVGRGPGLFALGLLLAGVGALSLPLCWRGATEETGRPSEPPRGDAQVLLPGLLAIAPMIALEVAIVRAGMPRLLTIDTGGGLLSVSILPFVLAVGGYLAVRRYGFWAIGDSDHEPGRRRVFVGSVAVLAVIGSVVAVWVILDPWAHAPALGVHGILGVFLLLVTVLFGSVGYALEGRRIPASLDFVGVRRVPLVTAVIAWAMLANVFADGLHYHRMRVVEGGPVATGLSTEIAFDRWLAVNVPAAELLAEGRRPSGSVPAVPLVFVTAAGGGIRAAGFTAAALECLFAANDPNACNGDPDGEQGERWSAVFAASGASGGSVGIAAMTAEQLAGPGRTGDGVDWVRRRLGTDLLSPELAWQVFVEAPNALLGFDPGLDRGEVLERTWERRFDDGAAVNPATVPLHSLVADDGWTTPLVFLNGTNLTDGCRVTVSTHRSSSPSSGGGPAPAGATAAGDCRRRRIDPATGTFDQTVARDTSDYLCADEDFALSTAAFASARFPAVSPTGILPASDRCELPVDGPTLSIGDSGYRDNTGASAVMDLWASLEPLIAEFNRTHDRCVVPLLVEIDNGHRNRGASAPPSPGSQLLAPLQGGLGVFATRDAGPIEQAAATFGRALDDGVTVVLDGRPTTRFTRLSLYEHPGVLAPLGWSLSEPSVDDLSRQLDGVDENRAAVELVSSWLGEGRLACEIA